MRLAAALGWVSFAGAWVACKAPPASSTVVPAVKAEPWETMPAVVLNHRAMRTGVETLASDAMAGRYTVSNEIELAVKWLRTQYQLANIPSAVGKDYLHRYALQLDVQEAQAPTLRLKGMQGGSVALPASVVASVPFGESGQAQGQVVFVGYGIEKQADDATLKDLSPIKLRGKVAMMLAGAPGYLEIDDISQRAQDIAELYDSKMNAQAGLGRKHRVNYLRSARKALFKVLCSYIPRESIPAGYFKEIRKAPVRISVDDLLEPLWPAIREAQRKRRRIEKVPLRTKLKQLRSAGAVAAIIVRGPASFLDRKAQKQEALPLFPISQQVSLVQGQTIPAVYLKSEVAEQWLQQQGISLAKLQESVDMSLRSHSVGIPGLEAMVKVNLEKETVRAPNLLAVIPGSDLAHEIVLVGGHFDHIGTAKHGLMCEAQDQGTQPDLICNGADDNASGTVAILEMARSFRRLAKKPRRTLVFVHFSGEELGLLGSRALVRDAPMDLSRVVAMINIDMIGRLGRRPLLVGGLATSAQWLGLLAEVDPRGLELALDLSSTSRSDHAAFVELKIPALFFFSGIHEHYHQVSDEASTLDLQNYFKITELIAELVGRLAFGAPIQWQEPAPGQGLVPELPGENPANVLKRNE